MAHGWLASILGAVGGYDISPWTLESTLIILVEIYCSPMILKLLSILKNLITSVSLQLLIHWGINIYQSSNGHEEPILTELREFLVDGCSPWQWLWGYTFFNLLRLLVQKKLWPSISCILKEWQEIRFL